MCTFRNTEIEAGNQTFYLIQSQIADTGLTSPHVDPISPGAWQSCHWSTNFKVTGISYSIWKTAKAGIDPESAALEADALTTRPTRRSSQNKIG